MFQIIYVSSATSQMSENDLIDLLSQCRTRNQAMGISGVLLYSEGNFIQVIEGTEDKLNAVYQRILEDERHTGSIIISKKKITERTFCEWSMGFKTVSKETTKNLDGYTDFLNQNIPVSQMPRPSNTVMTMLYNFKRSCA